MSPPKKKLMTRLHEEALWNKKLLSTESSVGLIQAVIFYLCKCFGVWQGKELRQIKTEHVTFSEDTLGKFVIIDLKNALGNGRVIKRYEDPNNPRSVYKIMKIYLGYLANDGPLIVRPISSVKDYIVYSPWPLGVSVVEQTICNLMQESGCGSSFGNVSACLLAIDTLRSFGAGSHCIATWIQRLHPTHKAVSKNIIFRECSTINCEELSQEACLVISHLLDPPYPESAVKNISLKNSTFKTVSLELAAHRKKCHLYSSNKDKQQRHDVTTFYEKRGNGKRSSNNIKRTEMIIKLEDETASDHGVNDESKLLGTQQFPVYKLNSDCTDLQNSSDKRIQSKSHDNKSCTSVDIIEKLPSKKNDAFSSFSVSEKDNESEIGKDNESEIDIDLDDVRVTFCESVTGKVNRIVSICEDLQCNSKATDTEKNICTNFVLKDNFIVGSATFGRSVNELLTKQTSVGGADCYVFQGHKDDNISALPLTSCQIQDNLQISGKFLHGKEPKSETTETGETRGSHQDGEFLNENIFCISEKADTVVENKQLHNSSSTDACLSINCTSSALENNVKEKSVSTSCKEMFLDHSSKEQEGRKYSNSISDKTLINDEGNFTPPVVPIDLSCQNHRDDFHSSIISGENPSFGTHNNITSAWDIVKFLNAAHDQVQSLLQVSNSTSLKRRNALPISQDLPKKKICLQKDDNVRKHFEQLVKNYHGKIKLFQEDENLRTAEETNCSHSSSNASFSDVAKVKHRDILNLSQEPVVKQSKIGSQRTIAPAVKETMDSCKKTHLIEDQDQENLGLVRDFQNGSRYENHPLCQPCKEDYISEMSDYRSVESGLNSLLSDKEQDTVKKRFPTSKNANHLTQTSNSEPCLSHLMNSSFQQQSSSSLLKCVSITSDSCSGQYQYYSDHPNNVAYQSVKVTKEGNSQVFTIGDLPLKIPNCQSGKDHIGRQTSEINFGDYFPQNTVIPAHAIKLLTRQGISGLEVILKIEHCTKQMKTTAKGKKKAAYSDKDVTFQN